LVWISCRKGRGTFYYLNGDRLTGDWSRDMPNGEGVYQYRNGDRFVVHALLKKITPGRWNKKIYNTKIFWP
jgi:hypothetical protein